MGLRNLQCAIEGGIAVAIFGDDYDDVLILRLHLPASHLATANQVASNDYSRPGPRSRCIESRGPLRSSPTAVDQCVVSIGRRVPCYGQHSVRASSPEGRNEAYPEC